MSLNAKMSNKKDGQDSKSVSRIQRNDSIIHQINEIENEDSDVSIQSTSSSKFSSPEGLELGIPSLNNIQSSLEHHNISDDIP